MNKEKIRKIISYTIEGICTVIIVILLFGYMMSNDKRLFGYSVRIVVSESMEPAINKNSISIIKNCNIDDIKTNDIICYRMTEDIIHRVVEIKTNSNGNKTLRTKGDNNDREDQVDIDDSMIIGKVVYTFNGIAPIIEKYSILPGKIDGKQLVLNILMIITLIYLIAYFVIWIIKLIAKLIKAFNKNYNFNKIIGEYNNNIEELNKYKENIDNICKVASKNNTDTIFRFVIDRIYNAILSMKIKELNTTIKSVGKLIERKEKLNEIVENIDNEWNSKH